MINPYICDVFTWICSYDKLESVKNNAKGTWSSRYIHIRENYKWLVITENFNYNNCVMCDLFLACFCKILKGRPTVQASKGRTNVWV